MFVEKLGFDADLVSIENSALKPREKSKMIATLFTAIECDGKNLRFNYDSTAVQYLNTLNYKKMVQKIFGRDGSRDKICISKM